MIAVAVGEPGPKQVVHACARLWLGPACNNNVDPARRLIPGIEIDAERVTCWACRNPGEAAALNAGWWPRCAKLLARGVQ